MENHSDQFNLFLSKFNFREEMTGFVGIERERFLTNSDGVFVPRASDFLHIVTDARWTYELSACQVEDRTSPFKEIKNIKKALAENDKQGETVARQIGLSLRTIEVAREDMPLDVYPDPRYLRIVNTIAPERLLAACRVTGTHLHLGMPNMETAIQIANYLCKYLDYFCNIGDHSQGERLRLYKTMALDWEPSYYQNVKHFFEVACKKGFVQNPRDCWHLIRISIHGTVEVRMFGSTENLDEICWWVEEVKKRVP